MILFIQDILVCSNSKNEHMEYLWIVLQTMRDHRTLAKFSKCEFWIKLVTFLGHIMSKDGIMVDPAKIMAIRDWACPTSSSEVCRLIGLASYYRQFVEDFTTITMLMTRINHKEVPF